MHESFCVQIILLIICVYFLNFLKGRKKAKVVEAEETTVVALYSFDADHFENLTFEKCNLLI